jgi:hypothetical protein
LERHWSQATNTFADYESMLGTLCFCYYYFIVTINCFFYSPSNFRISVDL